VLDFQIQGGAPADEIGLLLKDADDAAAHDTTAQ